MRVIRRLPPAFGVSRFIRSDVRPRAVELAPALREIEAMLETERRQQADTGRPVYIG
jgi:hypothetical protein